MEEKADMRAVGEMRQCRHYSMFPKTGSQIFILLLVFLNSGIFSSTAANPFGIKGVSEALEFLNVMFALSYLWSQFWNKGTIAKIDFTVFFLVMCAFFYSALAAQIRFGQPLYYGLIEERRILIFLIYFPLAWAFRRRVITVQQIFSWVVMSAFVCAVLSVFVAAGIVSPLKVKEVSENAIREDRYGIGPAYIALASLLIIFRFVFNKGLSTVFQILFLLGVLVVIVQTRQILIALAISSLFLVGAARFAIWLAVAGGAIVLLSVSTDIVSGLFLKYQALFGQLASESYLEESARALTIITVLKEFLNGAWFGSGSLSALWKGGFAEIYQPTFFLADVGFFGTIYKYGVLSTLFYFIYFFVQFRALRAAKEHHYYRLIMAAWIFLLVMLPVAATIEYRGSMSGLLLAMSLGCAVEASRSVPKR
ncbi:MAG: hypothetical protein HGB26_01965 [Desulfobulbaceae bacterium]|nr:hypothetical protein [Desulfobulbaceae bacterium]